MFTGIIQALGTITELRRDDSGMRLRVRSDDLVLDDIQLGDSIATNGVCLTVTELPGNGFYADVSNESLANTTLADWQPGQGVNLEKALTLQTPLGGHMVSGHVDGVGVIRQRSRDGNSVRLNLEAPGELARYIAAKGSITVDGVSLTVTSVDGCVFNLNIVPHSIRRTILDGYAVGAAVNLEVDLIARYLERLLSVGKGLPATSGITKEFLAEKGFLGRAH